MVLRWSISALALVGLSALVSAQGAPPVNSDPESFPDVVARVNDTEISKADLLRRADAIKTRIPPGQIGADFYHQVLSEMVSGELLYQSVETQGLSPTEAEVAAALENQQQRFGGEEAFHTALDGQGLTMEQITIELTKELAIQKLVETHFIPDLVVSEADTRMFYDGNLDAMQQPLEFKAAHILISVDEGASEAQKAELEQKAESIRNMVEMGQDFAELAAKNSGDPGSKDNGGELGWMAEGQTVPPFEAAMKSLAPGELSGIVETRYGYHIIKLQDRRGGGAMPYEDVKERIEEFLKQRGLQERIQQELELLRGSATIQLYI